MAVAIDWDDVLAIAPELSSVGAGSRAAILTIVDVQVNSEAWGDLYDTGCTFLAAHYGSITKAEGAANVTSETVGALSRTYASSTASAALDSTSYGADYLRLVKLLPSSLGLVI